MPKPKIRNANQSKVPYFSQKVDINIKDQNPKQYIHFLSIKPSDQNGYEQALQQLPGKIITMTATVQHLIVVTE